MASINKVILIGNLGRDPEVRYTPNGTSVANMALATSRSWKDKTSGEKVEETEWHRLVAYDRLAEICGEYLTKGASIYVEGRLKTRKWADKDQVERYTTEVIIDEMKMLGSRERNDQGGRGNQQAPQQRGGAPAQQRSAAPAQRPAARPATAAAGTGFDDMDDDIPFISSAFAHDEVGVRKSRRLARAGF